MGKGREGEGREWKGAVLVRGIVILEVGVLFYGAWDLSLFWYAGWGARGRCRH